MSMYFILRRTVGLRSFKKGKYREDRVLQAEHLIVESNIGQSREKNNLAYNLHIVKFTDFKCSLQ